MHHNIEIKELFEKNEVDDLKRFMGKRQHLNKCNGYLVYIFHMIQSAGILSTSIAASNNDKRLIWLGVGLNMIAGIIQVFEKINDAQMKKLMNDIKMIKSGAYVDESPIVDVENVSSTPALPQPAHDTAVSATASSTVVATSTTQVGIQPDATHNV